MCPSIWSSYCTVFIALAMINTSFSDKPKEYCLRNDLDSFEAICLKNEVVVVRQATYGRMKMGRCLEGDRKYFDTLGGDPDFLGCSVDILPFMDARCSGRNSCVIRGGNAELQKLNPCHELFKSYLEIGYDCAQVVEEDRSCNVAVTSEVLHIRPSVSSDKPGCGSRRHPWNLEAPVGQTITVKLFEFSGESRSEKCHSRGYVLEKQSSSNVSICAHRGARFSSVFESNSNQLQLILHPQEATMTLTSSSFLVQISAIGCTNMVPPTDAWLRRDGNTAVVGCYTSRQSWTLRCVENLWIGVIGNCTRDVREFVAVQIDAPEINERLPSNQEIAVVVVAMLGLILCATVICVGVICWKRYANELKKCKSGLNSLNRSILVKPESVSYMQNSQPLITTA